eukprot:gnl/TRDRNA2_/TRDRNA2_182270_c0_seq1.p1 gnl/TRDRNA2_/TRDRNA2_182270_c0~~gnl/TRDRNA2_/TRDRNA2_182270_c0_seq1.p1  ORF type:complete len:283 (-),score=40.31 gnl/TRDRNA2_/TRDRNA2_182270_c0_seq1:69-917(-)
MASQPTEQDDGRPSVAGRSSAALPSAQRDSQRDDAYFQSSLQESPRKASAPAGDNISPAKSKGAPPETPAHAVIAFEAPETLSELLEKLSEQKMELKVQYEKEAAHKAKLKRREEAKLHSNHDVQLPPFIRPSSVPGEFSPGGLIGATYLTALQKQAIDRPSRTYEHARPAWMDTRSYGRDFGTPPPVTKKEVHMPNTLVRAIRQGSKGTIGEKVLRQRRTALFGADDETKSTSKVAHREKQGRPPTAPAWLSWDKVPRRLGPDAYLGQTLPDAAACVMTAR